jgi:hypothetical protein
MHDLPVQCMSLIDLVSCVDRMFDMGMQCGFFSLVSDPTIGGTYMTLLNTITNLGGAWYTIVDMR